MSTDRPLPPTAQPRPMMDTSDTSMPPTLTRMVSSMAPLPTRRDDPPPDMPQVPELSLPPILEAAEETKPVEAPTETKPVEAPAEKKPEEAPAETKPDEAPAEKKPDEAIINEVVKDVVQDALGVPRSERPNAKPEATPEAKPDEAPKAPETGNDKIDEAKEVYDELVKGADFDPPPDIKRAHSDVAEEDSMASKVAKVDVMEPQTPRPVTSTA